MSGDDLLARMDERLKTVEALVKTLVTRLEFSPVKLIAYGLVASVLIAVLSAVIGLVIHK